MCGGQSLPLCLIGSTDGFQGALYLSCLVPQLPQFLRIDVSCTGIDTHSCHVNKCYVMHYTQMPLNTLSVYIDNNPHVKANARYTT